MFCGSEALGVTPDRVRKMIVAKRLKAIKVGREWLIDPKDLDAVKDHRLVVHIKRARLPSVGADSALVFIETPEKDRCDHSNQ